MTLGDWALINAAAVTLSGVGVVIVRKFIKPQFLKEHHDATDPMMACVGTLFAILLGFLVANAMTRFEEARLNVQDEAGATGDVFRLARSLPPPTNLEIMTDCVKYFDTVTDEEFALMADGKMCDKCWKIYADLWRESTAYEPKTQGQSNLHQGLVQAMTKLGECRRARNAQITYALPQALWIVVFTGAGAVIVFTLFFGMQSLYLQIGSTGIVTAVLVLNMYLLHAFDTPFSGDVKVSSVPFTENRTLFHEALAEEQNKSKK